LSDIQKDQVVPVLNVTSGRTQSAVPNVANIPKPPIRTGVMVQQPVRTNLQAAVAPQAGTLPKGLKKGNTNQLTDQSFFRCVLYSETSARKTTTAAKFAGPEFSRIILTRSEDQMIPLQDQGFQYVYAPDGASLSYALKNPHLLWPEWETLADPNRQKTIIVDDLSKAAQILVEMNSTGKDKRQAYSGALADLDSLLVPLTRKPYNMILISLAKVRENQISGEEMIGPDLSPSLLNYITAEFAAVFYIQTKNYKLLTERDRFTVMGNDPATGREKPFTREIFAKIKVPLHTIGKGIIKKEEILDLADIWKRIKGSYSK
jgi:hypothetical protein